MSSFSESMESATDRTKKYVSAIKGQKDLKSKAILLVGGVGAGKSSIVEIITGVTGLSGDGIDSVTQTCQIVDADVEGAQFFLIDTPGFNGEDDWEVFCDITTLLSDIKEYIDLVGVWYIVDNSCRAGSSEKRICSWVASFCGRPFYPRLTIITTFWGVREQLRENNNRLEQRSSHLWSEFQSKGAQRHEFGKIYEGGIATEGLFSWSENRNDLKVQAKQMVALYCHRKPYVEPQFLTELKENKRLEFTKAGEVLYSMAGRGHVPSQASVNHQSLPGSSGGATPEKADSFTGEARSQPDDNPAPSGDEQPGFWWSLAGKVAKGIVDIGLNVANTMAENAVQELQGGRGGIRMNRGGQGMRTGGTWDPNSIVDTFNSKGMDSSFTSRKQLWQDLGMQGDYNGSSEQNGRFLRKLNG